MELIENFVGILQPITISAQALAGLLEKSLIDRTSIFVSSKVETSFITMWITLASRLFKSSLQPDKLDYCSPLILQGSQKKTIKSRVLRCSNRKYRDPLTYSNHQFKWADISTDYYNRHKLVIGTTYNNGTIHMYNTTSYFFVQVYNLCLSYRS